MPGITVTPAVRAFSVAHPEVEVEVIRTTWDDQVDVLHDGRVDVSIVRLPIDQAGLSLRPLFEEPRVAMVPSDHRLAGKPLIDITDLADEHLLQDPDAVPEWRDIARELRAGRPKPVPALRSVEEKLEHVAAGSGISIVPLSVATFYHRPDVAAVPVENLAPNKVSLAWIASRRSHLIHDFANTAAAVDWL
jgi:DNA-binding transcriptional LysR family regulator